MRVNENLSVNASDLEEFQEIIGFRFKDKSYLIQALLHGSLFSGDKEKLGNFRKANHLENKDYEKLEYLGDSVLGLIIAEYAYHDQKVNEYAKSKGLTIEGVCTKIKVILASNENLKPVACKIKLSRFVLSEGHVNIDGKLADIIEALIGAIYLDGGYGNNTGSLGNNINTINTINTIKNANNTHNTDSNYSITRNFVYKFFDIDNALEKISISNPKGIIQEMFHKNCLGNPCYKLIDEEGPDHDKHFTVGLYLDDKLLAIGSADSKKKAEQAAANLHLRHLEKIVARNS